MNCIPYGPNAWLLRFADAVGDAAFEKGQAILAGLERHPPPGLIEVVPAFTTVLLEFEPMSDSASPESIRSLAARLDEVEARNAEERTVREIPVNYNGPDLDRVAALHNLTTDEIRRLHCERIYKVHLIGFAPGFPYLGELDPRLHTPRLAAPRPRVPAGSVAIGGEHTGIYSVESPGGWNIIGHTSTRIFDPAHGEGEAMFILQRGDRVRFVPECGT